MAANPDAGPRRWIISWSSLFFALLQSACSALIAISGLRVAIGLSSLAAAAAINAPARGFHRDAIRIPMMTLSLAGALVTLYILWHVRRLRNRPAAAWRVKPVTARQRNSERLQFALSILTLNPARSRMVHTSPDSPYRLRA